MNGFMLLGFAFCSAALLAGCWLGWQLLRQNGRVLLRLDELEKRFDELEFWEPDDELSSSQSNEVDSGNSEIRSAKPGVDQSLLTSAATGNGDDRSARFSI